MTKLVRTSRCWRLSSEILDSSRCRAEEEELDREVEVLLLLPLPDEEEAELVVAEVRETTLVAFKMCAGVNLGAESASISASGSSCFFDDVDLASTSVPLIFRFVGV